MADIARLVGVSPATVSRSLAGLPPITEETRHRVEQAARQLGYKVNRHARSLRSQRSRIILVIIPNLANENFPDLLTSIDQVAFELGYDVMIGHLGVDPVRAERLADELFTGGIDGILLTSRYTPARIVERFRAGEQLPVVRTIGPGEGDTGIPSVLIDEERAAYDVVSHMIGNGYRHIGHVMGPADEPVVQRRAAGWRRALAEAGLPATESDIVHAGFELEDGQAAARELLSRGQRPDAVFCSNDQAAFGLVSELKHAGLRIPADLAVAGFDDLKFSRILDPPLTTIRLPRREMAQVSLRYLAGLIEGNAPTGDLILPHELMVRESTAARGKR